jgi:hypothetical protein
MNNINVLVLMLILPCSSSIFGMEKTEETRFAHPIIVNCEEGNSLPHHISSAAIFGATPRLSQLDEFTNRVAQDAQGIQNGKPKGMRKDLQKLKKEKPDMLPQLESFFKKSPRDDIAMQCFFTHGFNTKMLDDNIATLLSTVKETGSTNLIHIFLPSYFQQSDFVNVPEQQRKILLKNFLMHSALFYKKRYEEQKTTQQVYIVIPPLDNFMKRMAPHTNDTETAIAELLKEELFDKGIKKSVLVNQNIKQLQELGTRLEKMGFSKKDITLMELAIYQGSSTTAIFNQYAVPAKNIPQPGLSCVLSDNFVQTFERLKKD